MHKEKKPNLVFMHYTQTFNKHLRGNQFEIILRPHIK